MSLKIENLSIKLQKEEILHDVSLEIKEGEFVSLLGASGCGKTTLLKSIAGLLETEDGSISIDGQKMDHVAPEKRGTVIVFQDLRLFPHMTVEKNISFALQLKKVPKKEQKKRVEKLLEDVQLSGYGDRRMKEMSGGQLQRVALARALAAEPKVLLLDEPFSGLDEKLRMEMGALVKRLHQEWKLTTILVTHDKREALQMSDRIALMSGGESCNMHLRKRFSIIRRQKRLRNISEKRIIFGEMLCKGYSGVDLAAGRQICRMEHMMP